MVQYVAGMVLIKDTDLLPLFDVRVLRMNKQIWNAKRIATVEDFDY